MSQPTTPGQPIPQGPPQPGGPGQYPQQPPYPQQPAQQFPQAQQYPQPQQQYQPQQAYPGQPQQPPYPQQQGNAPQGYQQQQGFAPQGYPPASGPRPPAGKSSKNLIMIVIGVVALLAIAGGVFLAMSKKPATPEPPVTPTPAPTQPTPDQPTPEQPTPTPDQTPTTPAPTPDQTTPAPQPGGSTIQLGGGVVVQVADGWQAEQKSPTSAFFTNGRAQIFAQMAKVEPATDPGQVCMSYHQQILKEAPDAKYSDKIDKVEAPEVVKIVRCIAGYTETQGGKSLFVLVQSFVSIRQTDGSLLLFTIFSDDNTPDSDFTAVNQMLNSALNSHIQNA